MNTQDHKTAAASTVVHHEGHGVHLCHRCGWPFPNPHPNARHRRAHKKVCGTIEGYQIIHSEEHDDHHLAVSDDDNGSDDDEYHHTPSPNPVKKNTEDSGRVGEKSYKSEDDVFADATTDFSDSGISPSLEGRFESVKELEKSVVFEGDLYGIGSLKVDETTDKTEQSIDPEKSEEIGHPGSLVSGNNESGSVIPITDISTEAVSVGLVNGTQYEHGVGDIKMQEDNLDSGTLDSVESKNSDHTLAAVVRQEELSNKSVSEMVKHDHHAETLQNLDSAERVNNVAHSTEVALVDVTRENIDASVGVKDVSHSVDEIRAVEAVGENTLPMESPLSTRSVKPEGSTQTLDATEQSAAASASLDSSVDKEAEPKTSFVEGENAGVFVASKEEKRGMNGDGNRNVESKESVSIDTVSAPGFVDGTFAPEDDQTRAFEKDVDHCEEKSKSELLETKNDKSEEASAEDLGTSDEIRPVEAVGEITLPTESSLSTPSVKPVGSTQTLDATEQSAAASLVSSVDKEAEPKPSFVEGENAGFFVASKEEKHGMNGDENRNVESKESVAIDTVSAPGFVDRTFAPEDDQTTRAFEKDVDHCEEKSKSELLETKNDKSEGASAEDLGTLDEIRPVEAVGEDTLPIESSLSTPSVKPEGSTQTLDATEQSAAASLVSSVDKEVEPKTSFAEGENAGVFVESEEEKRGMNGDENRNVESKESVSIGTVSASSFLVRTFAPEDDQTTRAFEKDVDHCEENSKSELLENKNEKREGASIEDPVPVISELPNDNHVTKNVGVESVDVAETVNGIRDYNEVVAPEATPEQSIPKEFTSVLTDSELLKENSANDNNSIGTAEMTAKLDREDNVALPMENSESNMPSEEISTPKPVGIVSTAELDGDISASDRCSVTPSLKEPVLSPLDLHETSAMGDDKTVIKDVTGADSKSLQAEVDDMLTKQNNGVSTTDLSSSPISRSDSLEGNCGSVLSDTVETNSQKHKTTTEATHPDKSDTFEAPSFMTLVQSGGEGDQVTGATEIETAQNNQQSKSDAVKAGWFPSLTNVVNESEGRKKNEEIIAKVTNWSPVKQQQHGPLKNLLNEVKSSEPKQVRTEAKDNGSSVTTVGSVLGPEKHTLKDQDTNKDVEEWNSPARYPIEVTKEKKKGKPFWVPFVCCSSVHSEV